MRKWLSAFTIFTLLFVLAACGSSNNASSSNDVETQSEQKKEVSGELNFYTSQPDEDAQRLVTAFNEKYPDVKVNTFRSGTEEVIAKLQAEKEAGNIQADVLLVADAVTFESLKMTIFYFLTNQKKQNKFRVSLLTATACTQAQK